MRKRKKKKINNKQRKIKEMRVRKEREVKREWR